MRTRAQAADPTALDLPYLSTTFDIPEPNLQALLDAPTTDLVQSFLASLSNKGQDFDSLQAEKLKVDVELENTVRTSETKVRAQKGQVTKHAKEIEELRAKLNEAESARESLASELDQLRSSTSGSSAETTTLRQRIDTLEASNRDALALIESKSTEKDRVATQLSEQHTKLLSLRREISGLEEKNQKLENAASGQKFKEQNLQQEIELLKRNNEWHSSELQTRTQEHAKFRKERNARIASLQRELEDSSAGVETLKRTEGALRQRLEELQSKTDEAFAKIAGLQEEGVRKEQDFRTALDSTKRLADLQAQSASTHKARLQEVQAQVDQIKEDAAEEIGRLQAEIETERSDKETVESKVAELELQVEKLEQNATRSGAGTPMRNGGFNPATPTRGGSPSGAMPGSLRKSVNGLSWTQLYSNYMETKQELEFEKGRCAKLTEHLDELVNAVESRSPEIMELKADQERLEQQVLDFSNLLDDANQTRESAVKESQHWQNEAAGAERESEILRQQLRDLSAQIKMLLVEIQSYERGLGEMSAQERVALERAARGELVEGAEQDVSTTDTDRFINERLVIFHSVSDLQQKNEQMLRLTRTLGQQLEGEEAREKERQTAAFASENEELKSRVQRLEDELQATVTQIDSYMKERDMFRRMLQHRGQLAPDADVQSLFGQSMGPPATPRRNGGELEPPTPRSRDVEDLNKLLKEQQSFFDQYRNESTTDRRTLKEQVDVLAREKSNLQADIARAQSQLQLAAERHEMLSSNFSALRNENAELAKRSQNMSETAARQDLRTQQVAEELVEARSMADSLRRENANSKAEKDFWKRIETRLTDDNKSLVDERSRLNKLVTDLQNLQNERELAESETRRRLQSRTESLESELAETKKKLEHEVEESRKASLRREYDDGQSRTRIDDLVKSLGNVREELIAAKTTRDQLQGRVEEMKIDLRSAEEKVVALQPRSTPRTQTQQDAQQNGESIGEGDDEELSAEQRLAIEVSELKRDLELARNELEAARQQVEQYRSISQSTEEELASFNETSEQYKEETDRMISAKDDKITALEQRIEDLASELTTTNNNLSELRTKNDEATRALDEQKVGFDADLARLRDDAERHTEEKKLYQEDLKAQAEIAQQAQQSYEDELLKHAEAARSLQSVRKEYNELRTEVAGIRAESEGAKQSLENGEENWNGQRDKLEREIQEAKRKREDVDRQNQLLHEQMESFSSELAALRAGRQQINSVGGEGEEGGAAGSPGRGGDGSLQEVIRFLRREKEIVDVQYELSIQEAKRVQQQLDYSNGQIDELRQKLAEERRHSQERTASEASTSRLTQTINELNLFREANTTLREEARQARVRLEERSVEIERLYVEIEPLKARVGELEGDVEIKDGELKLLQDDRDHWRERTQNIISKYDRVDPAELESMKSQIDELKASNDRLNAEQEPLKEQFEQAKASKMEAVSAEGRQWQDRIDRFKEQAKNQNRKQNARIVELQAELKTAKTAEEEVKANLEEVVKERDVLKAAKEQNDEEGEVREDGEEDHVTLHARIAEAEANASEHAQRVEELDNQVSTLKSHAEEHEKSISVLTQQLEAAQSVQAQSDADGQSAKVAELGIQVSELQQQLAAAQQQIQQPEGDDPSSKIAELESQIADLQQQLQVANQETGGAYESSRVAELESQVTDLQQQLDIARQQAGSEDQSAYVAELEGRVAELQQQLESASQQIGSEVQPEQARQAEQPAVDTDALEKLKQELTSAQQEVETLRASVEQTSAQASDDEHPEVKRMREEKDKYIAEMKDQHTLAVQQLKEENERKLQQQRDNLKRQLAEKKAQYQEEGKQEVIAEHSTEMQKLQEEHEKAVAELKEAHAAELEKLSKAGTAAVENAAEAMSPVKAEKSTDAADAGSIDLSQLTDAQVHDLLLDLSNEQVSDLLKTHERAKGILRTNINKGVTKETEQLTATVAEKDQEISEKNQDISQKDQEISELKKAQGSAANAGDEARVKELAERLEAVQAEKEKAVQTAIENAEKKAKVQISQRDIANAKLNYIKKAATETPEKPVKEVWRVAQTQKPAPKPTAVTALGAAGSPSMNSNIPSSPGQAQETPQSPSTQTQASKASAFGQSSASSLPSAGTFGQPSQGGALAQPARRPSAPPQQGSGPNPQAASFAPFGQNAGTGPAALQSLRTGIPPPGSFGTSGLPRAGGAAGRGGANGYSIQGTANQQGSRGSALPRGGGNSGRSGRGGNYNSGLPRGGGGQNNAGRKRSYDGGEGGDAKRTRGGGPGNGA
ncbi:hypothetical protein B0A50_00165 [Salinomyces thailandicus]|uniref:Uncharacterized protein n=1 Tax=Salinomyces thailandicus TaxID=706561 RepID=A0A4U0UHX4_9PEZI|nr:hypothetical protein B0A50_00165 [Salinomyces thailandica]